MAVLLVVDDQAQNREVLARRLERRGHEVLQAASGLEALEILGRRPVDLLLLDVMMPGMDGLEVLRRVRTRDPATSLPVLMVSADGETQRIVEALAAGANDYLTKPVDFPVALARIESQLRLRQPPPVAAPFVAAPGARLAHYELLEPIGSGGMGTVYRARDTRLGRAVAVKILPDDLAPCREHVDRFLQEARIMARLDHPGVVTVWDVGETPVHYLVMELLEGRDLDHRLQRGVLDPREAARLARDAARILQAVHEAGVLHRDLKPGNLMIAPDGSVKVMDFGISRLLDAEVRLTQPGVVMGTPAYMAPEQVDPARGECDARTDVYALGLILHEMLVGDVPHRHEGLLGMLQEILTGNPMSPRKARPEVPEGLDRICRKATDRKPERRYPSMAELARDLQAWLEGEG